MMNKIVIVIAAVAVIALIIGGVFVLNSSNGPSAATPVSTPSPKTAATTTGVTTPPTDKLIITDPVVGTGAEAKEGSTISVKYTGSLTDGTVFDSTDKNGGQPVSFGLSKGKLIDGWVQGIPGMKVGGKRKLVIPPSLGYGAQSQGSIPANSTLVFDIELTDVK